MIVDPKKNAGRPITSANLQDDLNVLLDPGFLSTRLQAAHFAEGGAVQAHPQADVINAAISKFRDLPLESRMNIMEQVMQMLVPEMVAQGQQGDQAQGMQPQQQQAQPSGAPAPATPPQMAPQGAPQGPPGQGMMPQGQPMMSNGGLAYKKGGYVNRYASGGDVKVNDEDGGTLNAGPIPDVVKQNMPPEATADDVPAFLSKGEFVMDAATTAYFGVDKLVKMQEKAHQAMAEKLGGQSPDHANGGFMQGAPRTPRVLQHGGPKTGAAHGVKPPRTTAISPTPG